MAAWHNEVAAHGRQPEHCCVSAGSVPAAAAGTFAQRNGAMVDKSQCRPELAGTCQALLLTVIDAVHS